jgi:hypothetical protein
MEKSDLSKAIKAMVLAEAGKLHEDLELHFAMLANECEQEQQYLEMANELAMEFISYDEDELFDLFFEHPPQMPLFQKTLKQIQKNIQDIIAITPEQRNR